MQEKHTYTTEEGRTLLLIKATNEGKRLVSDVKDEEVYGLEQPVVELDFEGKDVIITPTKILKRPRNTLTFTDEPEMPQPVTRSPQESMRYLLERIEQHETRITDIESAAVVK